MAITSIDINDDLCASFCFQINDISRKDEFLGADIDSLVYRLKDLIEKPGLYHVTLIIEELKGY